MIPKDRPYDPGQIFHKKYSIMLFLDRIMDDSEAFRRKVHQNGKYRPFSIYLFIKDCSEIAEKILVFL